MTMYHMTMQPQYGGAPPPHSSLFPGSIPPANVNTLYHPSTPLSNGNAAYTESQFPAQNYTQNVSQSNGYIHHALSQYGQTPTIIPNYATPMHQHGIPTQSHVYFDSSVKNPIFTPTHSNISQLASHELHFGQSQRQLTVDEELLEEMNSLHLGYLEMDDSLRKLEQREKLESVIMEYLAITAHNRKFIFRQVHDVLEKSVLTNPDFSAYGAACAFDALSQYAANLVSQPWRKEFREIKLHNGFWVHQICNHLFGAEAILELMGYVSSRTKGRGHEARPSSETTPTYLPPALRNVSRCYELLGVIDPDVITRLALDCLIAYCECQSLKKIEEGVREYSLSWPQILQFRQIYIGGVDVSLRHLLFTLRQQGAQTSPIKPPAPSPESINHAKSSVLTNRQTRGRGLISGGSSSTCKKSESQRESLDSVDGCLSSKTESGMSVPTANLIDLGSSKEKENSLLPKVLPHSNSKNHGQQKSNHCNLAPDLQRDFTIDPQPLHPPPEAFQEGTLEDHLEATLNLVKNAGRNSTVPRQPKSSERNVMDNWDFVYRGLEKKGYNKDIGDRGDILLDAEDGTGKSLRSDKKQPMTINQALHQLSLQETKERIEPPPIPPHSLAHSYAHETRQRNSLYDNVSSAFETANPGSTESDETKSVSLMKKVNSVLRGSDSQHHGKSDSTRNVDGSSNNSASSTKKMEHKNKLISTPKNTKSWFCVTCTFENQFDAKICDMCSKSKNPGPETRPLESGGKQCPLCTLINDRNVEKCSACGVDLKGSSTYI